MLLFPWFVHKIDQCQMPRRRFVIDLFFSDHTLRLSVNKHPWLDRCSIDGRRHKWHMYTLSVQNSIGLNSYLYYTHILSTPPTAEHIWNFSKLYKRVFLRHIEVSSFFIILSEHVDDCTCITLILFHIILLSSLLSFQQHQHHIEHLCKQSIEWISRAMNSK